MRGASVLVLSVEDKAPKLASTVSSWWCRIFLVSDLSFFLVDCRYIHILCLQTNTVIVFIIVFVFVFIASPWIVSLAERQWQCKFYFLFGRVVRVQADFLILSKSEPVVGCTCYAVCHAYAPTFCLLFSIFSCNRLLNIYTYINRYTYTCIYSGIVGGFRFWW